MDGRHAAGRPKNITIKDLAAELGLSITTISRALGGYSDVGEATRLRVEDGARRLGYRPNRNAQRLVTRRTHNLAWVQPDDERKFVDPHFIEVMAGVLRAARGAHYDIVMTSHVPERELEVYDRYVKDNSVDGFIIDLPRENDPRITYLLEVGRPFVVHGREGRSERYGWVDVDNYGSFYRLARLLIANGHRRIALINGDERFSYARDRRIGMAEAVADAGLPGDALVVRNSLHAVGAAGHDLTEAVLADRAITAIAYASILLAVEGFPVVQGLPARRRKAIALATMDDQLQYLDLGRLAGDMTFLRSSLREGGIALIAELARQCDDAAAPRRTLLPIRFHLHPGLVADGLDQPLPRHRRS